jgi:DNA-binding MarR family transcriptional regulator
MTVSTREIRQMFSSASLGAPENAVGFVLWRVSARYQREMDRVLEPLGLTNLQFICLALSAWFTRSQSATNQAELARFGGIHPMQLSQMLKTLESKEFITRERSDADSRAKLVSVTRAGLHALRQAFPKAIEVQVRLFGDAGRPGGNLHQILVELDRAFSAMEE